MGDLLSGAVTLAYLAAAAWVTGHALLHKEDSRAAVAWIGLAWLSPLVGSALYAVFGVNRIARKASRLSSRHRPDRPGPEAGGGPDPDVPENLRRIAAVARQVSGRRLTGGNALALHEGEAAATAMRAAIEDARHSLALASYIFETDAVGESFIAALARAQARGVAVRVLIDGVGGGYLTYPVLRRLRRAGVPAASFLHSWQPWRMPFLNLRNHKKLLIVDGTRAFTGGMNIGADAMARPYRIRDTHGEVAGPVARHLMQAFADDWSFTTGESLTDAHWWPAIPEAGPMAARALTSGPDEDMSTLETVLASAISDARERVRIVTPYFLPDRHLEMGLALATLRGVAVEIVIPERGNKRLMDWAMRASLRFPASAGWRVYLTPPPFDHSKLMTVDGGLVLIGSSNWDVRSHRLNFELDIEGYNREIAADVDALIDRKIAAARRLESTSLHAAPYVRQLRDGAARLLLPYL
mgnify:CR=1 FL=1